MFNSMQNTSCKLYENEEVEQTVTGQELLPHFSNFQTNYNNHNDYNNNDYTDNINDQNSKTYHSTSNLVESFISGVEVNSKMNFTQMDLAGSEAFNLCNTTTNDNNTCDTTKTNICDTIVTTNSILDDFINENTEINCNVLEELRIFEEYLNKEYDENNDYYENPITCAQVILNKQGILVYKCRLCKSTEQEFINVTNYQQHLDINHPTILNTKRSSSTDIETIFETNLETRSIWLNEFHKMEKLDYKSHSADFLEQLDRTLASDEFNKNVTEELEGDKEQEEETTVYHSSLDNKNQKKKRTPGYCEICQRNFNDLYNLRVHMMIHTGEMPYECETCGKRFRQLNKLKIHCIIHTNKKPYICEICGKGFRFRNYLSVHKRLHSGDKPYKCKLCDEFFHSLHTRRQHMKTKHNSFEQFSCEECGKNFTAPCYLKSHMKRHKNQRDYTCDLCDKSFYSLSQLKDHKLSHTDWKPHQCQICNAKFQRKSNFNQHMKIHSDTKTYICQICGKAFAQNAGLYGHMKSHHK